MELVISLKNYLLCHFRKLQLSVLVGVEDLQHGVGVLDQLVLGDLLALVCFREKVPEEILKHKTLFISSLLIRENSSISSTLFMGGGWRDYVLYCCKLGGVRVMMTHSRLAHLWSFSKLS